jgi:L-fuculose-phosphate aldolase
LLKPNPYDYEERPYFMNNALFQEIISAAQWLFERRLLDLAGGNLSVRSGPQMFITPRFSGSKQQWRLAPDDIVCGEFATDDLFSHPRMSREAKVHVGIYRHFPAAGAVIHAHPFHILPFCAASRPIEPVLEQTQKFGVIKVVKGAPAHSADLAINVIEGLEGQEAVIQKQAAAVLLPHHGIVVVGRDLAAAVDALERIDVNAWCILAQRSMPPM